jgi:hypothetical protein
MTNFSATVGTNKNCADEIIQVEVNVIDYDSDINELHMLATQK